MSTLSSRNTRPPRKKACNSCTKSKVRCSLEKPVCFRCQTTGRPCEYPASAAGKGPSPTETATVDATGSSRASYYNAPVLATPHPEQIPIPAISGQTPASAAWSPSSQTARQDTRAQLDFTAINLVPSINAEDIRDRWLRPYILPPLGRNETPKIHHPFTIQYISRVLSTYPRCMLEDQGIPPIIHWTQIEAGEMPRALANCYSLVRMWQRAVPGSETMVMDTLTRDMERLTEDVCMRP